MQTPIFNIKSFWGKACIFALLLSFGLIFGSLLGIVITTLCGLSTESLEGLRIIQICSQVFTFVFPPLAYVVCVRQKPIRSLGFVKMPVWGWTYILTIFTVMPVNNYLQEWNATWSLPDFMHDIQEMNEALSEKMMSVDNLSGLIINIIMIAGLAAVGEELLFRALIQPAMIRTCRNHHAGIIITAALFSLIHFELFSFMPRFALGLLLGYAFFTTKSIWVPMAMHFINNATIVVLYFFNVRGKIDVDIDKIGASDSTIVITLSVLCTVLLTMPLFYEKVFGHHKNSLK